MSKAQKNKDVAGADSPAGTAPQDGKRRPAATLRVEDCSASIWCREHMVRGELIAFYSVTFERSYKDRDGGWKYTKSFDMDSLGKLVSLCQQASAKIEELQGAQQSAALADGSANG